MSDKQILDIFYNQIIPEAKNGKVDCFMILNLIFNVIIDDTLVSKSNLDNDLNVEEMSGQTYEGILIPTLKITNKPLFDELLVTYVKRASSIYGSNDFTFLDDLNYIYSENLEHKKEEYRIKYIIGSLLANASYSDFNDPVGFLNTRIAMFNNRVLDSNDLIDLGHIDSIGARVFVLEELSQIKAETPYRIKSYLAFDDGYRLSLPEIYVGNTGEKYLLYGIQKTSIEEPIDKEHLKQIRKGFIAKVNGAPEHYLLTAMIFLSLCHDKPIEIIPLLIERWNAKRIAIINKTKRYPDISLDELVENQEHIQGNITDLLLRYFTKIIDVTEGIDFTSFPFDFDDRLHLKIEENIDSRCIALNELFALAKEYKNDKRELNR